MRLGKTMAAGVAIGVIIAALLVAIGAGPFLIKVVWGWVVPDLFPGAVQQGLIKGSISWFVAFKLTILIIIFGLIQFAIK